MTASELAADRSQTAGIATQINDHRLRSLDAIRGLAAFAVVLNHTLEGVVRFLPAGTARKIIEALVIEYCNAGRIGVAAFFLLSGYVIPFSFSNAKPIRSFVIARFFRLYPAYWASAACAVGLGTVLTGSMPSISQIVANLTMFQAVLHQPDLIGVYWTLFYELLFYGACLAAFIARRINSPRYLFVVVLGLTLAAIVTAGLRRSGHMTSLPIGIPMFLAMMHLGTLARLSDRQDVVAARGYFVSALIIMLFAIGPISAIGFIQRASHERLIADVTSLYIGFAIFFGFRRSHAICHPVLLYLGMISFSLYLFHPLIIDFVTRIIAPAIQPAYRPAIVISAVPIGAISIAAASHRLIEVPGNALGKRLRKLILEVPALRRTIS